MVTADYIPQKDGDLVPWLENFIAIGTANLATLGLTTTIIADLTTLKSSYATKLNTAEAKQLDSKAATEDKNLSKKDVVTKVRTNVKQIQARPAVSDTLKAQLGITVPGSQPSPQHPLPPANLVAIGGANGTNSLSWNRTGNPPNTIFIIEYRHAVNLPWLIAGSTTKTTFEHNNQTPGNTLYYHVKAQRSELISQSSNEAIVYAEGPAQPTA